MAIADERADAAAALDRPSGPAGHQARRAELGHFLKARRSEVTPHDVGLPPGPRRRTPGLRREEVALLAGVGVTWYTWLEQGRSINVSSQVLDAVAGTLRLDKAGREHMYRLAEAMPLRAQTTPADSLPAAVHDVLNSLDPVPASLSNGRFDLIESNAAYKDMFHGWHLLPCVHKNSLWCCVTESRARHLFINYDEEIAYMVARFRAAYALHVGEPEWEEDIRRLSALSPEFVRLWDRHEVAGPQLRIRRFRHPVAGVMTFTATEFDLPTSPDVRLVVHTPYDAQTWARLPQTRHPAEPQAPS
jgi:transcriptional regulator with XRE-family HTH domain